MTMFLIMLLVLLYIRIKKYTNHCTKIEILLKLEIKISKKMEINKENICENQDLLRRIPYGMSSFSASVLCSWKECHKVKNILGKAHEVTILNNSYLTY